MTDQQRAMDDAAERDQESTERESTALPSTETESPETGSNASEAADRSGANANSNGDTGGFEFESDDGNLTETDDDDTTQSGAADHDGNDTDTDETAVSDTDREQGATGAVNASDPVAELDRNVASISGLGSELNDDPFDELEGTEGDALATDAFDAVAFEPVDADDLWAAIESGGQVEPDVGRDSQADVWPEYELDKREYCQRCPHFTAPPDTACEHADGEILEVVDGERFRVRGCPMVTDGGPLFDRHR